MNNIADQIQSHLNQQQAFKSTYAPVFYRLTNDKILNEFNALLAKPGLIVVDQIHEQVRELLKSKNPSKKFSNEEYEQKTKKHFEATTPLRYGVWVYYPWTNRLVHILDEKEFIDVRTSRNHYKITPEERDILAKKKVGVIGLSVGQSVSVTLAMERICGELRLADFDLLELTNLNRIRTGVHNLGLAKVYSVAREIAEIDPFITVKCFPDGLTEDNMDKFFNEGGKLDLMVEESDGFDIKILSRYKARELKVPVIMEASDRCMVDVERFDLEPQRPILHGIVDHLDIATLKSLKTNEEKIPYMLDILGLETTTARLKASMLEMQHTINTWPQLASAVTMGGGITADVSRRMLLNQFTESGRYYVDIDELIGNKSTNGEENNTDKAKKADDLGRSKMKAIALSVKQQGASQLTVADAGKIVAAAIAAPSYGNKQPWKWLLHKKGLYLFFDKTAGVSFMDGDNFQAYISHGAAIENVVIMAGELGYKVDWRLFPLTKEKDLVGIFEFHKTTKKNKDASLAKYIIRRYTNRKSGKEAEVKEQILHKLAESIANVEGASVSFVTDKEKITEIGKIVGTAERIRLLHPLAHHEYFTDIVKWSDKQKEPITEGVDFKTLELPPAIETAFRVLSHAGVANLLNQWQKGIAFEKLSSSITSSSSAIGLISMPGNTLKDWINGGMAGEKMWLTATKNSLAFQPICLPLSFLKQLSNNLGSKTFSEKNISELKAIKTQLSLIFSELNKREGVFLFRLFEAEEPLTRSLRKPLKDVFFKS
jgi:tRNA A37 threonylcarbamoyladenosine dehydratase